MSGIEFLLFALLTISCIIEHKYKDTIVSFAITIGSVLLSFNFLCYDLPYKTVHVDTYDVIIEQQDNQYIVKCENKYVNEPIIKILPLDENVDNVYHFVGEKDITFKGNNTISGTLYIYQ